MRNLFNRFRRDEEGATAIEYGLIAALVALPIIAVLPGIGTRLRAIFNAILVGLGGTAV
ncbi:MAG: Flp family type IVb pilin [Comamonadaceae bacterium]|nr:MAG: Flp family type IVb pilin [Comamonadaceae bacterium]